MSATTATRPAAPTAAAKEAPCGSSRPADLSRAELYARDGYLPATPAFRPEVAAETRRRFDALQEEVGLKASTYDLHNRHADLAWAADLVAAPEILDVMEELLGPDILLLDSRFICKHGLTDEQVARGEKSISLVSWHQDCNYWPLEPLEVTTVWLAVDDADVGNGCMQLIPGTHTSGLFPHGTAKKAGNLLSMNQEIVDIESVAPDGTARTIPIPVPAGSFSVHEGRTVHMSMPNNSTRRRCGFVLRYMAGNVMPVEDPARPRRFPAVLPVRGCRDMPTEGYFDVIKPPEGSRLAMARTVEETPTLAPASEGASAVGGAGAGAGAGSVGGDVSESA